MGGGSWTSSSWDTYAKSHVHGKSRASIFSSSSMKPEFNPALIKVRESRDSVDNPQSTPIIVGVDVTGSMGSLAELLITKGLNTTFTELIKRKPVSDPHVMALAIGDSFHDSAPLQATQFEADIRIAEQLKDLWLEGGGGANAGESYSLAHAFAALKTVHDAAEVRSKKGFLFTVGDEPCLDGVSKDHLKSVLGIDYQANLSARDCVEMASRHYEVFHIIVDGSYAKYNLPAVRKTWDPILPQRVIYLKDPNLLSETIVSTIEMISGNDRDNVISSWDKSTALVIADATKDIVAGRSSGKGLRRL
jgi:hypothetical protein